MGQPDKRQPRYYLGRSDSKFLPAAGKQYSDLWSRRYVGGLASSHSHRANHLQLSLHGSWNEHDRQDYRHSVAQWGIFYNRRTAPSKGRPFSCQLPTGFGLTTFPLVGILYPTDLVGDKSGRTQELPVSPAGLEELFSWQPPQIPLKISPIKSISTASLPISKPKPSRAA